MSRAEQDDRLAALARATHDVAPSAGFADAIMDAVAAEAPPISSRGWRDGVVGQGRFAVAVAAVAAAASLALSLQAENDFDDEVMASVELIEVSD